MSPSRIALLIVAVIIGLPLLMALWSFAGSLVTTSDSFAVFVGFAIYAVIGGWIVFFVARVIALLRRVLANTD